jgi:hypothetical protein
VHYEIPALSSLLEITGSFIAEVEPNKKSANEFKLNIEQKGGAQSIEKCEGGEALTLLLAINEGKAVQTGVEAKEGTIIFKVAEEAMA